MSADLNLEIQAAEATLKQAMINSDVQTLDHLLADDLVFTNHLGQLMTKKADLDSHRSGVVSINQLELSDQHIKILGDIAVVNVAARISGTFAGKPFEEILRFTRVWQTKTPGYWQVIVGHATTVVNSL